MQKSPFVSFHMDGTKLKNISEEKILYGCPVDFAKNLALTTQIWKPRLSGRLEFCFAKLALHTERLQLRMGATSAADILAGIDLKNLSKWDSKFEVSDQGQN